jgi:hypothetical protein
MTILLSWMSLFGLCGCSVFDARVACGRFEEDGLALLDAHLRDDTAVAKMGHPALTGWAFLIARLA